MSPFPHIAELARARVRSASLAGEGGYVIVIVLAVLAIGLAMGAAAVAGSLDTKSHANRDLRVKRALQAADTGVQSMLYQVNELDLGSLNLSGGTGVLNTINDCLPVNVNANLQITGLVGAAVNAGGTCSIATGPGATGFNGSTTNFPVGNHAFYQAQFMPGATAKGSAVSFNSKIVSAAYDDNGNSANTSQYTIRRVEAILAPVDPFKAVEANHDLTFNVTAATVFNGTARAGHNLTFSGLAGTFVGSNLLGPSNNVIGPTALDYGCAYSHPLLIVPVVLGGINQVPAGGNCGSPYFKRPPVSINSSKASCVSSCAAAFGASYIGGNQDEIYNANPLTTLTFQPGDYVFCSFNTNGPVSIAATNSTVPVRIFIDSPSSSRCSSFVAHNGISAGSFTASKGVGNVLSTLTPAQAQIYVVGNGTNNGTTVTSTAGLGLGQAFFLYAPTSNVTVSSPVLITGTIVGYDVTASTILYTQSLGLNNYSLYSGIGAFHVQKYVECTPKYPLPAPDPTVGC